MRESFEINCKIKNIAKRISSSFLENSIINRTTSGADHASGEHTVRMRFPQINQRTNINKKREVNIRLNCLKSRLPLKEAFLSRLLPNGSKQDCMAI